MSSKINEANDSARKMPDMSCDRSIALCPNSSENEVYEKSIVINAFFARKIEQPMYINKVYKVKSGDTLESIVKENNCKKLNKKTKLKPGKTITLKVLGLQRKIGFKEINSAVIGTKVYLFIETRDLENVDIKIEILSRNKTFVNHNEPISVLHNNEEKVFLTTKVGEYAAKPEYKNAQDFKDKAIIEVELKPNDNKKIEEWSNKINTSDERKALLYLRMKAETSNEVKYFNQDAIITSPTTDKGIYLNKKGLQFELYTCHCDKDITVDELQSIFTRADKTTLKEMAVAFNDNEAYKKLGINTCLRKAHFFSQCLHEVGSEGKPKRENLNYKVEILKNLFSYFRNNEELAKKFGKIKKGDEKKFNREEGDNYAHQTAIANIQYGKMYAPEKLENELENDWNRRFKAWLDSVEDIKGIGWVYRGGGYIQVTHIETYKKAQIIIDEKLSGSVDILNNVENITKPKGGMVASMVWWYMKSLGKLKLNERADNGDSPKHVDLVSKVVNKSKKGYPKRRKKFDIVKDVFKTADCPRRKSVKNKSL